MDLKIFELQLKTERGCGIYLKGNDIIIVNDINDIDTLIHEVTHHLYYKKDIGLKPILDFLNVDFNSVYGSFSTTNNKMISDIISDCEIKKYYPVEDYINECIAYFMGSAPEDIIRSLNITEYDKILDGDFSYCDKDYNIIIKECGLCIDNLPDLKVYFDFFKEMELIG